MEVDRELKKIFIRLYSVQEACTLIPEGSVSFTNGRLLVPYMKQKICTPSEFWAADFVTITGEETVMLKNLFRKST